MIAAVASDDPKGGAYGREVPVFEVREVLGLWLMGHAIRAVAHMVRCDRKTVAKVVTIAKGLGLSAGGDVSRLTDRFVGEVMTVLAPDRHGDSWVLLLGHRSKIEAFVKAGDVPAVKMVELLGRQGVFVATGH